MTKRGFENCSTQSSQTIEEDQWKKRVILDHSYEEALDQCCGVLPGDLMVEILQRLPVKSLLRFESISKPWYITITSPVFIAKHLVHQKHEASDVNYLHHYKHVFPCENQILMGNSAFNDQYPDPGYYLCPPDHLDQGISLISKIDDQGDDDVLIATTALSPFPVDIHVSHIYHVCSSNGLVCIEFSQGQFYRDKYYEIWNPATRKIKVLPNPQLDSVYGPIIGFSYIPRTASYKLVRILVSEKNPNQWDDVKFFARVEVLHVGVNCWTHDEKLHELPCFIDKKSVLVNGCLHWLKAVERKAALISFDLDKEVFTQKCLPINPFDDTYNIIIRRQHRLAVFEGNLAMFVYHDRYRRYPGVGNNVDHNEPSGEVFEVWIYEEMSQSWRKKFIIGPLPIDHTPVGFWGNREIIIAHARNRISRKAYAYLYNPYNKEKKKSPCSEIHCNLEFHPYVECLVQI